MDEPMALERLLAEYEEESRKRRDKQDASGAALQ
jgi:hypothetical protein